ncbi:hypothetical protein QJS10_CPB18g01116 [Acorus calamus]|uniref:PGG domain-containing protein n=1 Tax=Acorus calamus TaxID=4465 RepID=A0AAV9CQ01_ACOCL|nr:hypothetical protein QJS10_CPB18g01116 [Acorus calamus]
MEKLMEASLVGDVTALLGLLPNDTLFDQMVCPPVTQTPLHAASMRGHTAFASMMLRLKPELSRTRNSEGYLPIHLASTWGRVDIVIEMVAADKSLARLCDGNGCTALHAAAANNQVEVLEALLKEEPGLAREVTAQGETALHVALKNFMIGAATHLIAHCKDILNVADGSGNTALHCAVTRKQVQILKILLAEEEIQKNVENAYGLTPLDMIQQSPAGSNDAEIIRSLSHAGCKSGGGHTQDMMINTTTTPTVVAATPPKRATIVSWMKKLVHWNEWCKKDNEWRNKAQRELMVVATLISAAAFQGGIHPPDDKNKDTYYFFLFLRMDMLALMLSATVIVFLVSGLPLKHRITTWLLTAALWLAVTFLVYAFVVGVSINGQYADEVVKWAYIAFYSWISFIGCLFLYHFLVVVVVVLLWLKYNMAGLMKEVRGALEWPSHGMVGGGGRFDRMVKDTIVDSI